MAFAFKITYDTPFTVTIRGATQQDIDELDVSKFTNTEITTLNIKGDYIQSFSIPEGIEVFGGRGLGLRELNVPDSLEYLYCSDNFLTHLELGKNIVCLEANNNKLEALRFRGTDQLWNIRVENNRLSHPSFGLDLANGMPRALMDIEWENNPVKLKDMAPEIQKFLKHQDLQAMYGMPYF